MRFVIVSHGDNYYMNMKDDLTGQAFGHFYVIKETQDPRKNPKKEMRYWECRCDCGNIVPVSTKTLLTNKEAKCHSCVLREAWKHRKKDLSGNRFGKLLVIRQAESPNKNLVKKQLYWLCKCDCGNTHIASTSQLTSGKTTQCTQCGREACDLARRKDRIGEKFGLLTITDMIYAPPIDGVKQRTKCKCRCECGNEVVKTYDSLKKSNNEMQSCGCIFSLAKSESTSTPVIGQKFGRLTVIDEYYKDGKRRVLCQCDCGNVVERIKTEVTSGHTKSCGCLWKETISETNTKDWTGEVSQFGIKFIKQHSKNEHGTWLWECECHCGNHFVALPANILSGERPSCGCIWLSRGAYIVKDYLDNNHFEYKQEYSFDDLRDKYPLRFDFAVFNQEKLFFLIEYDGKQHENPVEYFGGEEAFIKLKQHDKMKDDYCKLNNIPLLRIKHDLTIEGIQDKLQNALNP